LNSPLDRRQNKIAGLMAEGQEVAQAAAQTVSNPYAGVIRIRFKGFPCCRPGFLAGCSRWRLSFLTKRPLEQAYYPPAGRLRQGGSRGPYAEQHSFVTACENI